MDNEVTAAIERARTRMRVKTRIQDLSEPLTGQIDQRRIANKLSNVEQAVGELADALEALNARFGAA